MTARNYNFTKQNGTLYKAGKRFTKQSGVKKRILAGWTKRNGVVEQVYRDTSRGFYTLVTFPGQDPNSSYPDGYPLSTLYTVDEENIVCDCNTFLRFWGNYENSNTVINMSDTYKYAISANWSTYCYAGGVVNNQSLFGGVRTLSAPNYGEAVLSSLTVPQSKRTSTTNYSLRAPLKASNSNFYYGYYTDTQTSPFLLNLYRVPITGGAPTSMGTVLSAKAIRYSYGLSLTAGVSYLAVSKETAVNHTTSDTANIVLLKNENGSVTEIPIITITTANSYGISCSLGKLYTLTGGEVLFSISFSQAYIHNYCYLCKCTPEGVVTTVQVARGRRMIGTYNNHVYVIATDEDSDHLCVIEKYDSSLQLVGTHSIPSQAGVAKVEPTSGMPVGVSNSNSRYGGFNIGNSVFVLDLAQF